MFLEIYFIVPKPVREHLFSRNVVRQKKERGMEEEPFQFLLEIDSWKTKTIAYYTSHYLISYF